mmetsp:Transcript_59811/g.142418  ORF Transcript_59811/g.142418 Transcript_59811/m.142418 type:complete len:261 (+) Transcript_59811:343-1125(+)
MATGASALPVGNPNNVRSNSSREHPAAHSAALHCDVSPEIGTSGVSGIRISFGAVCSPGMVSASSVSGCSCQSSEHNAIVGQLLLWTRSPRKSRIALLKAISVHGGVARLRRLSLRIAWPISRVTEGVISPTASECFGVSVFPLLSVLTDGERIVSLRWLVLEPPASDAGAVSLERLSCTVANLSNMMATSEVFRTQCVKWAARRLASWSISGCLLRSRSLGRPRSLLFVGRRCCRGKQQQHEASPRSDGRESAKLCCSA